MGKEKVAVVGIGQTHHQATRGDVSIAGLVREAAVEVNPSGGALAGHALMATGLVRIGEAFRQISEHGRQRTLGHATSGPCLQQNLVCVLEGDG